MYHNIKELIFEVVYIYVYNLYIYNKYNSINKVTDFFLY